MPIYPAQAANRRGFLKASAIGIVGGQLMVGSRGSSTSVFAANEEQGPASNQIQNHRIQKMTLRTAVPLKEMAAFYKTVLEMKIGLTDKKLTIQAGATQINFIPAEPGTHPFYHFAFNIPENKIISARSWLGSRTKLSVTPEPSREPGIPNDVMPFSHWNAHSLFFWDPAGNILELICRHDLKNGTKGDFRPDEIHYASEIGFVTEDVNALAREIELTFQLQQYRGGGSTFRAIGDETGLLILFKRGGTPVGARQGQSWQIHPTDVTVRPQMSFKSSTDPHTIKAG